VTQRALDALRSESARLVELAATFTPMEWAAPSGCAGWRVQDVVCHMGCVFHSISDPATIEAGPPDDVEAAAEVPVQARRGWSPERVVEYYRDWAGKGFETLAGMQQSPTAETEVPLGNLGVHPLHLLANALVFDHYCHIRHDIGASVDRAAAQPRDDEALHETRVWMLAGLPQMCAARLRGAVTAPVGLVLEGPGGGSWIIEPAGDSGLCQLTPGSHATAAATLSSSVHDFVSWGTRRRSWRDGSVTISGDAELAGAVADAINVI